MEGETETARTGAAPFPPWPVTAADFFRVKSSFLRRSGVLNAWVKPVSGATAT